MTFHKTINENIRLLNQDLLLLENIPFEIYTQKIQPYTSSVGEQIRHIIRRYEDIIQAKENIVDYTQAERKITGYTKPLLVEQIETITTEAIRSILHVQNNLENLTQNSPLQCVEDFFEENRKFTSNYEQELRCAASHTIHHHAVITHQLAQTNFPIEEFIKEQNYGFNLSTLHAKK